MMWQIHGNLGLSPALTASCILKRTDYMRSGSFNHEALVSKKDKMIPCSPKRVYFELVTRVI
jgi:hypothetical protein